MHSAAWKDDLNYHGKAVAVLGSGSSGVQIVPAIQPGKGIGYHRPVIVYSG